mmetsp:Transcript_90190/g.131997  ORF Transcript_90190/g.131997 Transcript_90190/m.131997 type:complete len:204 (+) Transcript_90190:197-808(+)
MTVVEVVPLVAGAAPIVVGRGVVGAVVGILGLLVQGAGLGVLDERLGVEVSRLLAVKSGAHLDCTAEAGRSATTTTTHHNTHNVNTRSASPWQSRWHRQRPAGPVVKSESPDPVSSAVSNLSHRSLQPITLGPHAAATSLHRYQWAPALTCGGRAKKEEKKEKASRQKRHAAMRSASGNTGLARHRGRGASVTRRAMVYLEFD